ncbi:MAG: alcohol dehydrogenase catalytic domain-containing protein, partial [Chloroflexi bacterium]|nr:alcohol dehydrogenase catalytic domain-containing protein [Chloroflexota bacterium]
MRAIRLTSLDGPEGLELAELPTPEDSGRLVVEVHAAGVGFPDLLMTRGRYQFRPDPPFVPGIEMAGVVQSAPEGAGFVPGDRVAAWSALGSWAEYALAGPATTFKIPDDMSYAKATTLVNYQSAYFGLVERGAARAGETVLIHGASGATGLAAVHIAKLLDATVIVTSRSD